MKRTNWKEKVKTLLISKGCKLYSCNGARMDYKSVNFYNQRGEMTLVDGANYKEVFARLSVKLI